RAVPATGLGLLRGEERGKPRALSTLGTHNVERSAPLDTLILTKTNARATVHRRGYMDYIGVLSFDKSGKPVREERFLGLFTSSAYNRRPWDIPVVRRRYENVMRKSGLPADGHSGKALKHILESLPRDELFQSGEDELFRTSMGVLGLQERVRSRIFLRRDKYGRFYSALVYIPRDRFNTEVRLRIESMLKDALNADHVDSSVQLGESPLAQLHIMVRPKPADGHSGTVPDVDVAAIEARLARIVRNWADDLRDALVARHGEEAGLPLANAYGRALPAGYIENVSAEIAANDVENLAALTGADDLRLSLYRSQQGEGGLRFKFYREGDDIPLSDALPMMENMGLRVISEHPYRIEAAGRVFFIQDFEVEYPRALEVSEIDVDFEEAFAAIWRGQAENDGFNRLILAAGLSWRQVGMLRAYCKYLLQIGVTFSQAYMEQTLARYPLLARLLVELFEARFDPTTGKESKAEIRAGMQKLQAQLERLAAGDATLAAAVAPVIEARTARRDAQVQAARDAVRGLMDRVSSLDEDRILRSFMGAIEATLRTSYYQAGRGGATTGYVSYKFDSAKVPDAPKPKPYREIFVCGPRVEGVHLRFGPVARGGLRWSDRREDFRTEVLGLVKAQMVKNTVIVPVGSKGGFIVKRPPAGGDRDAMQAEGVACYRMFINGLLDITDNIVGGRIVAPDDVVRYDDDDPYLVVAADKGTATFSDIANGIAREHGFWMDDAFASGGSVGYDHKGMGITARGAWESVKRHFFEIGVDSQSEQFTAVGIGDMSGDVFGNGMLRTKTIKLVAAFDHRDIFLDPNPEPEAAFTERQRLYDLPRSSWADYNKDLISAGGGVFSRSLKSVPVSAEVRELLGLPDDTTAMAPNDLLKAILSAKVDLLYNGGIGTYIKASTESHGQVGDRANDAIRVDGRQVQARIIGEGGNLGMTQRGRIEAAANGVILNTDAIDNSAGVDTSDREVNIKIFVDRQVKAGAIDPAERADFLISMTDNVADLVLETNFNQNVLLLNEKHAAKTWTPAYERLMDWLEEHADLNRELEFLPSNSELEARRASGGSMTTPELAVITAYAKIQLAQALAESDLTEDDYFFATLKRYFPSQLSERFGEELDSHPLRNEIVATVVANEIVNIGGITYIFRAMEETGATEAQIAKVFCALREIYEYERWFQEINLQPAGQDIGYWSRQHHDLRRLLDRTTRWFLNHVDLELSVGEMVERYAAKVQKLRAQLPQLLRGVDAARFATWREDAIQHGLTEEQAIHWAGQFESYALLDIADYIFRNDADTEQVATTYFALYAKFEVDALLNRITALPRTDRWKALARAALRDDLYSTIIDMTGDVLDAAGDLQDADARVAAWEEANAANLDRAKNMFQEVNNLERDDMASLSVALRLLRSIVRRK
ncbi:MAG TPA: NAD-glutamate dehydrogenase, partial [Luteimonas sp.]